MSLTFDEFGNPYIIIREQEKKQRIKGLDAIRVFFRSFRSLISVGQYSRRQNAKQHSPHIAGTEGFAHFPAFTVGMDKMLVSQDGDVTVTNDGATIMKNMDVEHQVAKLLVELSQSQDDEVGDGTTGVVVLAGAMLEKVPLLPNC